VSVCSFIPVRNIKKRVRVRLGPTPKKKSTTSRGIMSKIIPPGAFSTIGSFIGGALGGAPGATIGGIAGNRLSKVVGFGTYKVQQNSLADVGNVNFAYGSNGFVIKHREFIQDIKGSVDFMNTPFVIQPGSAKMFPWLHTVASTFEKYRFLGLLFEYVPTSGNVSSTGVLGTVVMATNYDVKDPPFQTKAEMEAYQYVISTVPSNQTIHMIECKPTNNQQNWWYVRQDKQTVDEQLLYDFGLFQIATSGMTAVYPVGELWVTYHVCLSVPKMSRALSVPPPPVKFSNPVTILMHGQWNPGSNEPNSISVPQGFDKVMSVDGYKMKPVVVPGQSMRVSIVAASYTPAQPQQEILLVMDDEENIQMPLTSSVPGSPAGFLVAFNIYLPTNNHLFWLYLPKSVNVPFSFDVYFTYYTPVLASKPILFLEGLT